METELKVVNSNELVRLLNSVLPELRGEIITNSLRAAGEIINKQA